MCLLQCGVCNCRCGCSSPDCQEVNCLCFKLQISPAEQHDASGDHWTSAFHRRHFVRSSQIDADLALQCQILTGKQVRRYGGRALGAAPCCRRCPQMKIRLYRPTVKFKALTPLKDRALIISRQSLSRHHRLPLSSTAVERGCKIPKF